MTKQPLQGIRVLDFTTLLPGPMATLFLTEAGAEVIKIERPGMGDEMRTYEPMFGDDGINFALLNRGKRSIAINLKDPAAIEQLRPLLESADVLVEQFRPGVMDRLGLGYEALKKINPKLIYCAITGYGQDGPKRDEAGHDLNYVASSGLLNLAAGADGAPVVPPALIADIAGGTYPATLNILLALRQRDQTGEGCYIDIAMSDHLFTFTYWAMGQGEVADQWPTPGGERVTGGWPRYQVYRTADDQFVAAAPLEQRFWDNFCELIGLEKTFRDDRSNPQASIEGVAEIIHQHNAEYWQEQFRGKDVCCNIVTSIKDALNDPQFVSRGLFSKQVGNAAGVTATATPVPVASAFRSESDTVAYPLLGEGNDLLKGND